MDHRRKLWLFFFLVSLAPVSALADNWPSTPGLGLPIAVGPDDQRCAGICSDGSGGSIVLCQGPFMSAQRVDRLGRLVWGTGGITLSPAGGPTATTGASIASDGAGGAFAAWVVAGFAYYPLYTKLRMQRVRADGTLLTLYGIDLAGTDGASYASPGLVPDGKGGAIIAWLGPQTSSTFGEVFVQRLDLNGAPVWSEPRQVSQSPVARKDPAFASDGAGGIVVAWKEQGESATSVFAQRIGPDGALSWGSSGIALSSSGSYNGSLAVNGDGRGGFVIAWPDARGAAFAQRLDGSGVPNWTPQGMPVANVPTESMLSIVADQDGGAYVGMFRREPTGPFDLFVQHVTAEGAALWDPAGVRVGEEKIGSHGPLGRFGLQLVSDGNGGTIAAWSEFVEPPFTTSATDCRAQRFDAAGNRLWGSMGAPVSLAPGSQDFPFMIPDGNGGATLAWTQGPGMTTTATDVYGQHLNRQGKLGTPAIPIEKKSPLPTAIEGSRLSIQAIRPNPMSDHSSIHFSLDRSSRVRLSVLDVSGHCLRVLHEGPLDAGAHEIGFDAKDERGARLPAGLYFVSVENGRERQTRRIVVY